VRYTPEHEAGQHLRLTLESDGEREVTVLDAMFVDEPLEAPDVVVGPLLYQVFADGQAVWTQTLPDPFVAHGQALDDRGHFFEVLDRAVFVVRAPVPAGGLPGDYEIRLFRANAELPETVDQLDSLLQAKEIENLGLLGTVSAVTLREHLERA
jgi:hypothetical protein